MKKLFFLPLLFAFQCLLAQDIEVDGTIQIMEGAQAGYILTSDADGVASWSPPEDADRKQIFVTDFGAKGDGTTDDTNAFQTAIDSADVQGNTVNIPAGNYKITQTLSVPAGVQLKGAGLGNSLDANSNSTSGSRISFYGSNIFAIEFLGDYVGCRNMTIVDAGGIAAGGIIFTALASGFGIIGAAFNDLFLLDFINGTSIKLEAFNRAGVAFCSFENIHIRNAKKGIHIAVDTDGSFINLVTFRSINISGTGFEHAVLTEGGLTTTDWYSLSIQTDCPSAGHIVLNTGLVNMYGLHIESEDAACSDETVLIQLADDTRGSYIHGTAGKGRIIDNGSNFIDLTGESSVGIRPSGNNLFQNAGFKGLVNDELPLWEFIDCSGCTTPTGIAIEAPEWQENHNVLKLTLAAGQKTQLSPKALYFTRAYQNKECLFGAMMKSDASDVVVAVGYERCTSGIGFSASSAHPNDDNWHFVGKPSEMDADNTCPPKPRFVLDNSAGSSPAVVYITTPSFVFSRGVKPALAAGPITSAGGIMTGTLTTPMLEVTSPADNILQLTADANVFQISSTNAINSINPSIDIFAQGTMITLLFESSGLAVTHDDSSIKLLGATNYVSETYSTLKLLSLGNGVWQEIDRNCVSGCAPALFKETDETSKETIVLTSPANLETTTKTTVKIYPNPTKYGIHVALSQIDPTAIYRVQLMDSSGRTLFIKALDTSTNWIDFTALNLAAGRYQVHVLTENEAVYNNGLIIVPN